jgi:hypothetical protein
LDVKGEKTTTIVKQLAAGSKPQGIANYPDQNSENEPTINQSETNTAPQNPIPRSSQSLLNNEDRNNRNNQNANQQTETETAPQNPMPMSSQNLTDLGLQNPVQTPRQNLLVSEELINIQESHLTSTPLNQNSAETAPPAPAQRSSQGLLNNDDRNDQNANQQPETNLTPQNSIPHSSQNLTELGLQNPIQVCSGRLIIGEEGHVDERDDFEREVDLYQYHRVEAIPGFFINHEPHDLDDLPPAKRQKISDALDRRTEAARQKKVQQERKAQPPKEPPSEEPQSEVCVNEGRRLQKDIKTVEGIYFLYKFNRSQWRARQPEGADLTDEAYRKAEKLPIYPKKELRLWRKCRSLKHMPRFCESRAPPDNKWTMEEKIAWADHDQRETRWIDEEMERQGAFWNTRKNEAGHGLLPPGYLQVKRVLAIKERQLLEDGKVHLTEHQEDILNHSLENAQILHDLQLQQELDAAHRFINEAGDGAEVPYKLDSPEDERLQSEARDKTEDTLLRISTLMN